MNVNSLPYITFSFDFAARHHITEGGMFGIIIFCGFFAWIDCMIKKNQQSAKLRGFHPTHFRNHPFI